jgi:hypothetical protein
MELGTLRSGLPDPMRSHDLEKRVEELEAEIAALRERTLLPPIGIRRRASWSIAHLPLYEISLGSDPGRRQLRGHARAIIAIGDVASGVLAIGGYARGVVAIGGLATGLVSFGGLSLGLLSAFGGLAIGGLALGGAAVGGVAVGGSAAGYYACGAASTGMHVVSATERSPDAGTLFRGLGLAGICDAP